MNARYQTDWVAAACGPLSVRMAQEPAEVQLLRDALNCGHSLKAGRPAGHVLWLCANEGLLPRSLAFDGKAIGALKGRILGAQCSRPLGGGEQKPLAARCEPMA